MSELACDASALHLDRLGSVMSRKCLVCFKFKTGLSNAVLTETPMDHAKQKQCCMLLKTRAPCILSLESMSVASRSLRCTS